MFLAYFSRLIRGWALVGLLSFGAFASAQHPSAPEAKPTSVELILSGEPGFRQAGYYAALWSGAFKRAGLDVVLCYPREDESLVQTLLVDPGVYVIGGDAFFAARMNEHPVVLLAAIQQETSQALQLLNFPGRRVPAALNLRGKRLLLRPMDEGAPVRLMLQRMGAGPEQADWVEGLVDDAMPEQVDAIQGDVFEGDFGWVRPADHGVISFYGDCLFASEAELAYHPDRVEALRATILEGWRVALADVDAMIAQMQSRAEEIGLVQDRSALLYEAEISRGLIKPATVPLGRVEDDRVNEVAQAMLDLGMASVVRNLDDFVYRPRFRGVPRWVYGIGAGLVIATLIALAVIWFNVRLQRRVQESTQKLRESQERYREMFQHAPVAIVEEDYSRIASWILERRADGVTDLARYLDERPEEVSRLFAEISPVRVNQTALELVGVDDVTAYARCLAPENNASLQRAFREELLALWRGELDVQVEMTFTRIDGSKGYGVLQWTVPMVGGRPDFARVLVVVTEVTALRSAEMKLRESEERFRTLFESAIEGVYESTPEEGIVAVNPAFARIFGCATPESLLTWSREIGAGNLYVDPGRRHSFLKALGDSDAVFDFESKIECADGSQKWISENVRAVRDASGRLIRVQGFVTDISDRKRFETELAEERERLSVTLRAMTEGVVTTDERGVVRFVNEAAEELTGWAEGAAIGRRLGEVCVLRHERTRADVPVPFDTAMRSATVVDLPRSTHLVHRTGTPRLIEGRCAPIHDARSRPVGVVLVLRDVTERARHESEMMRTTKLESLGVLAGGIAHDFNNLLTVVLGNLHLARRRCESLPDASRWLQDADLAAEKAQGLTRQLLTFSKGGNPLRSAVRLAELVREATAFALHGSKVRSEFQEPDRLWAADVDRSQIGQVVQNLVLNAVQAMPDGGVVKIDLRNHHHRGDPVRSIAAGDYLMLQIEDNGIGIPAENLGRIFDPYFTTKETGSGLGLASVYSIIKRHAGHIDVSSEVGEGTRFRILLPALPEASTSIARETSSKPTVLQGRVLFMDDEESIRRMAETLLKHLGLQVETVANGEDVLQRYFEAKATGTPFDIVLMDLTVPGGMGGREAMEQLRKLDPQVRAIVSSGYSIDPVMADFASYGFCARVAKPYRASDLARVLRDVLAGRTLTADEV